MTKVKICGLMRLEDVQAVNTYLPDYIGLIFAPSRRRLSIAQAQALCGALSGDIQRVGVFVNEDPDVMMDIKRACDLDVLQIYQDDPKQDAVPEGEVWRCIRVKDESSLDAIGKLGADAYLLDAYSSKAYGGVGETFNWALAQKAAALADIVLAGGLTPDNVETAILSVSPYAVDVSSGVETYGQKDADKIRDFILKARRTR